MDKSTAYPSANHSLGPYLDEEAYRKLIQLVCFLHQLSPCHDTESLDNIDDDSESVSSLDDFPEIEPSQDSEVGALRQVLVDAIAFVASTDRTATHVVAVAVEELKETYGGVGARPTGLRFRLSMNGGIPESMLSELKELGKILGQTNAEDYEENNTQKRVFDYIIQMKKRNLAKLLKGGLGPADLLSLFKNARRKLTVAGNVQYPPYSCTLEISPEESEKNGAYTIYTHESHMKAAWSYFEELDRLCKKSAKRGNLDIEAVKELVLLAFQGRHSKCFRYLLTLGVETASTKLYQMLRKLSRYWKCALDLVMCVQSGPFAGLFQNIEFCAIPRIPAKPLPPSSDESGLSAFLQSLGYHELEVIKRYSGGYSKANDKFGKLQRKELFVHAEIGLIYFYATHSKLQPACEIGCSKHACLLCNLFIKHHPYFKTPTTHRKVYPGWGLPSLEGVTDRSSSKILHNTIKKTIQDIEKTAKAKLYSPRVKEQNDLAPDSSSGVSKTDESGTIVEGSVTESVAESVDTVHASDIYSRKVVKDKIMNQRGFPGMARHKHSVFIEATTVATLQQQPHNPAKPPPPMPIDQSGTRRKTTKKQRADVIILRTKGHSFAEIEAKTKVPRQSARRIVKRFEQRKTLANAPGRKRPSKLTERDMRRINRYLAINPRATLDDVVAEATLSVAPSTVQKALKNLHYRSSISRRKFWLNGKVVKARRRCGGRP